MRVVLITTEIRLSDGPSVPRFFGLAANMQVAKSYVLRAVTTQSGVFEPLHYGWSRSGKLNNPKHKLTVTLRDTVSKQYFYCQEKEVVES